MLKFFSWTNGFHCNSQEITSLIPSQFTTKDLISPLMNKELKSLNSWSIALMIHNHISSKYLRNFHSWPLTFSAPSTCNHSHFKGRHKWPCSAPNVCLSQRLTGAYVPNFHSQVLTMEGTCSRSYDGQCWTRKEMNSLKESMLGEQHFQKK